MNVSNQEENRTLGYLGDDFQYKLCKYLIEYPDYYNSIKSTLNPNAFTVPVVKTIICTMNDYNEEFNSTVDYSTLRMLLNSKFKSQKDRDIINNEVQKIQEQVTIANDKDWVRKQSSNFFKQQELVKAINQAREIIAKGDADNYDQIKTLIETALNKVSATEDMGRTPFDDIEGILKGTQRKPIPTGIRMIDERTNGGIGKGELGLICGPSGFGKTSSSCALASYAGSCRRPDGKMGYNVLYIFFEDTYLQIQRKFMARELNIEACMLNRYYDSVGHSREDMAYLDSRFRLMNKNVRLHKLKSGQMSASEIESMIKNNYIDRGFVPDLVIIDYFECVCPEKGTYVLGQHEREAITMRRIETMSTNLNVGLWVTTQGTKDSASAELITQDKISGSAGKFQISHICMAIMKSQADRENNTASIVFLKNRAGACGTVMTNVGFNNGTCRINTEGSEVMGFEEFREREDQRKINMETYIGQLKFTALVPKADIPKDDNENFFGGENDSKVPF